MKKLLFLLFILCFNKLLFAQSPYVLDLELEIVKEVKHSYYFEWIDVDNDGDLDLSVLNNLGHSIYINQGNNNYTLLNNTGLENTTGFLGKWSDFDFDGLLDLYVTNLSYYSPNELYKNIGNGAFVKNENMGAVTTDYNYSTDFEWVDFDNDGDMDLYVGNGDFGTGGIHNWLFENVDGVKFNKIFGNAAAQDYGSTKQTTWLDIDNDGDLDLYVGNNNFKAAIYINKGNGFFSQLEYTPFQKYMWLNAVAWADYNGDGRPDALVIDKTAVIYVTNADLTFTKIDLDLGLQDDIYASKIQWGDYDNDGDLDFVTFGSNKFRLFRNNGNHNFNEASLPQFDLSGVRHVNFSDPDKDGNLDIYVSRAGNESSGRTNVYLRNEGSQNNWLLVKSIGSNPRHSADNAKVYLYSNGRMQYRSRINYIGRGEGNSLYFHFGLGSTSMIDSLVVKWPSGINQVLHQVAVNQLLEINEPLPPLPDTPSQLHINVETYRKVTLNWQDLTHWESHYVVERKKEGEPEFAFVAKLPRNTTTYIDFGLDAEAYYQYRVYAINKAGASNSIVQSVTTIAAPDAPLAPTHLMETHTAYQVNLHWEDISENETALIVERLENGTNQFKPIAELLPNTTSYIDEDVSPKSKYYYRVAAANDGILSLYSNTIEVTTGFIIFRETAKFNLRVRGLEFIETNDDNRFEVFGLHWGLNYNSIMYDIKEDTYDSVYNHIIDYSTNYINMAIGDMDNDNKIDYVFNPNNSISIHNSNHTSFEQVGVDGKLSMINMFDLDSDGKNELVCYGEGLRVYRQLNLHFLSSEIYLLRKIINEVVCFDYDNDGDKDLIVFYRLDYWSSDYGSKILEYDKGTFLEKDFQITHSVFKALPADYDNDGDLDMLLIGLSDDHNSANRTYLYKNEDGQFRLIANQAEGNNAIWVDYDNDGDLDLIISGVKSNLSHDIFSTTFHENLGSDQFVDAKIFDLPGAEWSKLSVADFDDDGDMDLAIYLESRTDSHIGVYKNHHVEETGKINHKPTPPNNLQTQLQENTVTFTWNKSTDEETPQLGLTYNLLLKRKGSNDFVISPLSNITSGIRKINRWGNVGNQTSYIVSCLSDGDYEWSVQSIDPNNNGSEFATFQEFSISGTAPAMTTMVKAQVKSNTQINLSWIDNASNEIGYIVERKTNDDIPFHPFLHIIDTLPANTVSYIDKSLESGKTYIYRISSYNCSRSAFVEITATTLPNHFDTDPTLALEGVEGYYASFADYNNDGSLDVLINYNEQYSSVTKTNLFKIESNKFQKVNIPLVNTRYFSWVDMNNDGYLDIFVSQPKLKAYLNKQDGTFYEINFTTDLPSTFILEDAFWADYDNDGDLDGLIMGPWVSDNEPNFYVLNNEGSGKYEMQSFPFKGGFVGYEPWGDFNNDGLIDIVATEGNLPPYKLVIYKNKGNRQFERMDTGLSGINIRNGYRTADIIWGDYNNDGFLDLLLVGQNTTNSVDGTIAVYKNNNGRSLTPIVIDERKYCENVSARWGDLNNDGLLDILVYGYASNETDNRTRWYKNLGHDKFLESGYSYFDQHSNGMVQLADYDNDGDLDFLHLGKKEFMENRVVMFRNNYGNGWNLENTPPLPPSQLSEENTTEGMIKLIWDNGFDDLSSSLSYNVVLKSENEFIVVPNALDDGTRTLVGLGNAGMNKFMLIKGLKKGTYEWAVQSIDNIYKGSTFSEKRTFTVKKDGLLNTDNLLVPKIYPNPVKDYVFIDFNDKPINGTIEFISVEGKLIYKVGVSDQMKVVKIGAENLRKGIILVKITGENLQYVEKLVF